MKKTMTNQNNSVRQEYEKKGVKNYYENFGDEYKNYHIKQVEKLIRSIDTITSKKKILDMCCGTGEVTRIINSNNVTGLDPYMDQIYRKETGNNCYKYSFLDIANNKLTERFDIIICSFGLHLCEKELYAKVLWNLSMISPMLITISPSKKLDCNGFGWSIIHETVEERVHMKAYISMCSEL